MKYRVKNGDSFDGGPMFFVKKAFNFKILPGLICVLLCIYDVEVYQFNVVCESISRNVHIDKIFVVFFFTHNCFICC
ncbi:MAG: sodium:alanine symporter family protein [Parachlamydiales bacterium]|nr:sodium:alanine symporter family protein [Parachlamydiales bacterium]